MASKGRVKWTSKVVLKMAEKSAFRTMEAIGNHLESKTVALLSVDQEIRRGRDGKIKPTTKATPGAPPRVFTGRLRQSITHTTTKHRKVIRSTTGTNVKYAKRLEAQNHRYLTVALKNSRNDIMRIVRKFGNKKK